MELSDEINKLASFLQSKGYDSSFLNKASVLSVLNMHDYARYAFVNETIPVILTGDKYSQTIKKCHLQHQFGISLSPKGIKINALNIILTKADGSVKLFKPFRIANEKDMPSLDKTRFIAKSLSKSQRQGL